MDFPAKYCLVCGVLLPRPWCVLQVLRHLLYDLDPHLHHPIGSLATAVITWRNSLVFHDGDKMISMFIHIYPPLVLTVIRHFYKDAGTRFPAVASLPHLSPLKALAFSSLFCGYLFVSLCLF